MVSFKDNCCTYVSASFVSEFPIYVPFLWRKVYKIANIFIHFAVKSLQNRNIANIFIHFVAKSLQNRNIANIFIHFVAKSLQKS
jgi:hypothetical protein